MIEKALDKLKKDKFDIYHSLSKKKISYFEDGNQLCHQVEDKSFWF